MYIILRLDGRVRRSGKVSLLISKPLSSLVFLTKKMVIVLISLYALCNSLCNGSNSVLFLQGMPDWAEISNELPPMDDVLSKLER